LEDYDSLIHNIDKKVRQISRNKKKRRASIDLEGRRHSQTKIGLSLNPGNEISSTLYDACRIDELIQTIKPILEQIIEIKLERARQEIENALRCEIQSRFGRFEAELSQIRGIVSEMNYNNKTREIELLSATNKAEELKTLLLTSIETKSKQKKPKRNTRRHKTLNHSHIPTKSTLTSTLQDLTLTLKSSFPPPLATSQNSVLSRRNTSRCAGPIILKYPN